MVSWSWCVPWLYHVISMIIVFIRVVYSWEKSWDISKPQLETLRFTLSEIAWNWSRSKGGYPVDCSYQIHQNSCEKLEMLGPRSVDPSLLHCYDRLNHKHASKLRSSVHFLSPQTAKHTCSIGILSLRAKNMVVSDDDTGIYHGCTWMIMKLMIIYICNGYIDSTVFSCLHIMVTYSEWLHMMMLGDHSWE